MPLGLPDFVLDALNGGLNTTDALNALNDDECAIAQNVEWFFSRLGERRRGCASLAPTGTALDSEAVIVFAIRHFPTENDADAEFWVIGATPGSSVTIARRTALGVWSTITIADTIDNTAPNIYNIQGVSFDNKLFLAYKSNVDRLHVWDGTSLRRTGLAQPAAPTVANTVVAGAYTGTRYFRVRYIVEDGGGHVLVRSEPSDATTFTPSGTNSGAVITKPASIGEGETHWEIEASANNADFYRIATEPVATTTYTDTTQPATDYALDGELSADIGTYALQPSAKYLAAADDRLLLASSWEDATLNSRVMWSPVTGDPTAVGNDERVPATVDYFIDLNSYEGGGITGITKESNGSWYALKWSHIYKLTRTGVRQRAYDPFTVTKERGAIPGSLVSSMDGSGRSATFFLDPHIGPNRIGVDGLKQIHGIYGERGLWSRVNVNATVAARGVYYPDKHQVWWWVAVDGSDTPTLGLKLQTTQLQVMDDGRLRRGWSTVTGQLAQVFAATLLQETISVEGGTQLVYRPYVGMRTPYLIQRADVGVNDAGTAYRAILRSKPFFDAGLLNRWGAMAAALLASADSTASLVVSFIRNFEPDTSEGNLQSVTTDLAPVGAEEYVIKPFDNLRLSEATGIQIQFADPE